MVASDDQSCRRQRSKWGGVHADGNAEPAAWKASSLARLSEILLARLRTDIAIESTSWDFTVFSWRCRRLLDSTFATRAQRRQLLLDAPDGR